jgi:putative aminopeptidase FrvX
MDDWRRDRIGAAERGESPTVLARMRSGFAVIGATRLLPGYCVLLAAPRADRLEAPDLAARAGLLHDMPLLGVAMAAVCRPLRLNRAIPGNADAFLRAHLSPRYAWEPAEHRGRSPFAHPPTGYRPRGRIPAGRGPRPVALRAPPRPVDEATAPPVRGAPSLPHGRAAPRAPRAHGRSESGDLARGPGRPPPAPRRTRSPRRCTRIPDFLFDTLAALSSIHAVPGQEQPVIRALREIVQGLGYRTSVDVFGNLDVDLGGPAGAPLLLIDAHTDEIGAVVQRVLPGGFLGISAMGGARESCFLARHVMVAGHPGVCGIKPGHFSSPDERGRLPGFDQLLIDVGAESAEEVAAMGIRIGSPVTWVSPLTRLGKGERVAGKAIDNRLSCAVLCEVLRQRPSPRARVVLSFTSQEEVGLRGAKAAASRLQPDVALAVDTVPCGGTPDVPASVSVTDIGRGPVVPLLARGGSGGYLAHPAVVAWLEETAGKAGVPIQWDLMRGGNNDAAAMQQAGRGAAAAALCLPRRYSHSPVEMADLRDARGAAKLIAALIADFSADRSFAYEAMHGGSPA